MIPLEDMDRKILARVQGDLPLEKDPFRKWAVELGITPGELVERLKALRASGVVREVKAVLRHGRAGFSSGAMVAWAVPGESVDEKGREIAARRAVSHCYERPGFGAYKLFSMIHGKTRQEVEEVVAEIARTLDIREYKVYWSVAELKKSSMEYFREGSS
jgi:siroheme decarboxylase